MRNGRSRDTHAPRAGQARVLRSAEVFGEDNDEEDEVEEDEDEDDA